MSPRYDYGRILEACAAESGCTVADLLGPSPAAVPARARHRAFYLAHTRMTNLSLSQIGSRTGGRSGATVDHGVSRIARLIFDGDTEEAAAIARIELRLATPGGTALVRLLERLDGTIAGVEANLEEMRALRARLAELV